MGSEGALSFSHTFISVENGYINTNLLNFKVRVQPHQIVLNLEPIVLVLPLVV